MKIKKLLSSHGIDCTSNVEHKSQGTNTTRGFLTCEDNTVVVAQCRIPSLPDYPELHASSHWTNEQSTQNINHRHSLEKFHHSPDSPSEVKKSKELLPSSLKNQQLELRKEQFHEAVTDKEQQLTDLKRELEGRDRLIQQQKHQLDEAMRNLTIANKTKAFLTTQLAEQDKKFAIFEQYRDPTMLIQEELQVARDALQSLRKGFRKNDSHHHTIDTLEQSIALLMERLHFAEMEKVVTENLRKQFSSESFGTLRRMKYALPSNCLSSIWNSPNCLKLTKVIYFTDKAVSPYLTSIPKRIGEITLRDFKEVIDQPGNYRFHFKALDPEYGMVKEEVMQDEDILPGWEDKIVAWVETDHYD